MRRGVATAQAPTASSNTIVSPKPPLATHPAFAKDGGATNVPSLKSTGVTAASTAASVDVERSGAVEDGVIVETIVEENVQLDRPNPYKYDRETFLSYSKLTLDEGTKLDTPEGLDHVWSVEVLTPLAHLPLTELEEKVPFLYALISLLLAIVRRLCKQ